MELELSNMNVEDQLRLASKSKDPTILSQLSNSTYWSVCLEVAKNPHTAKPDLKYLANHWSDTVSDAAIFNPNYDEIVVLLYQMTEKTRNELIRCDAISKDDKGTVRIEISKTSIDGLVGIATDTIDRKVLSKLARFDNVRVQCAVAKNSSTLPKDLSILTNSIYWMVRYDVACNSHTQKIDLDKLSEDQFEMIRNGALANPNYTN